MNGIAKGSLEDSLPARFDSSLGIIVCFSATRPKPMDNIDLHYYRFEHTKTEIFRPEKR
jgi:hypothetical protein